MGWHPHSTDVYEHVVESNRLPRTSLRTAPAPLSVRKQEARDDFAARTKITSRKSMDSGSKLSPCRGRDRQCSHMLELCGPHSGKAGSLGSWGAHRAGSLRSLNGKVLRGELSLAEGSVH